MAALGLRAASGCIALVAMLSFSSVSRAEVINWNENPTPLTIAALQESDGLLVGDKLFTDFSVISSGNASFKPGAADITISGIQSNGEYGVLFNSGWFALSHEVVDTMINFSVEVAAPSARWLIKDNTLGIGGVNVNSESPGAVVLVTENVFAAPPPQTNSIADKLVYKTAGEERLLDHQEFTDPNGLPVAYSKVWVVKDITLFGGTGDTGLPGATLSAISQTFSQTVPEPQSVVLLLCGLPGLALMVWRRYRVRR
jgi:hypothetical protein